MSECEHCEDLGVAEDSDGCAILACPHCETGREASEDEGAFWLCQSRWACEHGDCESFPKGPDSPSDEWFAGVDGALRKANREDLELVLLDLAAKYAREARLAWDAYEWAKVPVGAPVIYRGQRTATASEIFIRGGRAVIRLDGLSSYYDVRSVELLREVSR
jgi:hypothetical protein